MTVKTKGKWGTITVRTVPVSRLTATVRERLHLDDDSTAMVEVYQYHRPTWEEQLRERTAKKMAEAFEKESGNDR